MKNKLIYLASGIGLLTTNASARNTRSEEQSKPPLPSPLLFLDGHLTKDRLNLLIELLKEQGRYSEATRAAIMAAGPISGMEIDHKEIE